MPQPKSNLADFKRENKFAAPRMAFLLHECYFPSGPPETDIQRDHTLSPVWALRLFVAAYAGVNLFSDHRPRVRVIIGLGLGLGLGLGHIHHSPTVYIVRNSDILCPSAVVDGQ